MVVHDPLSSSWLSGLCGETLLLLGTSQCPLCTLIVPSAYNTWREKFSYDSWLIYKGGCFQTGHNKYVRNNLLTKKPRWKIIGSILMMVLLADFLIISHFSYILTYFFPLLIWLTYLNTSILHHFDDGSLWSHDSGGLLQCILPPHCLAILLSLGLVGIALLNKQPPIIFCYWFHAYKEKESSLST